MRQDREMEPRAVQNPYEVLGVSPSASMDEIRDAYKRIFQQESVLRSDRCCERVRF